MGTHLSTHGQPRMIHKDDEFEKEFISISKHYIFNIKNTLMTKERFDRERKKIKLQP